MKADLPVSPLAPEAFPDLPEVGGIEFATASLGLYGRPRDDLLVVRFAPGASVAGAFTTSLTRSDDVNRCAAHLAGGTARVLVVNAGNSNAFTGAAGVAKNDATVEEAVLATGCAPHEVFISATGVIGAPLPPRRIADHVGPALANARPPAGSVDWERAARAFMTTDTFPKASGRTISLGGRSVNLVGLAKGSGMIAPNMATMLVYLFTDAAVSASALQAMVSAHVETTFNAITVDSDTSTSDTLLVFATGAAGNAEVRDAQSDEGRALSDALHSVMHDLALQVVRDGEGAQKLIRIGIEGAASDRSARTIAMSIANSPLVKTAIAGQDANWGRVVMAIGKAGEPVDIARLSIRFGGIWTARDGGAVDYDEGPINAHMAGREIDILAIVGDGPGRAIVWTCDLTHGYIAINGDYRS